VVVDFASLSFVRALGTALKSAVTLLVLIQTDKVFHKTYEYEVKVLNNLSCNCTRLYLSFSLFVALLLWR